MDQRFVTNKMFDDYYDEGDDDGDNDAFLPLGQTTNILSITKAIILTLFPGFITL